MVNLIITLISIALIAIVAVAALYNGGDAFRQGSADASAAQLMNAGQQISAANELYAVDNGGTYTTSLTDLTDGGEYLSSVPRLPEGVTESEITIADNGVVTMTGVADEVCVSLAEVDDVDSLPTTLEDGEKGCFVEATDGNTFQF